MVSVTLSIPEEIKHKMEHFSEINCSGFIRKCIFEKTKELSWKERMLKEWKEEKAITEWAVQLQRTGRNGRFEGLRKKGLV